MALALGGERLSIAELPANPRVTVRLLRALDGRRVATGEIARLVLCDPALTLQLLLAVGTGTAAQAGPFSMESCVAEVGHEVVDALAFRHATREFSERVRGARNSAIGELWRRALVCAESAAGLARRCGQAHEPAYVAGLLHEVGKLALLTLRPGPGGTDTTADAAGAALLKCCSVPAFVADAVRLHGERAELLSDAPFLVRAVNVASRLSAEGATDGACRQGQELLGPHERAIARVLEDAIESAQSNPAGIDLLGGASPATQIVDGDLPGGQWQSSPSMGRASGGWEELGRGLGDAALRAVLSRALVAAKTEHEALLRARRLASVLLGMERHCFFLVSAQDKALVGAPIERDPPHLEELRIALATSGSLLAIAARERRPMHALGQRSRVAVPPSTRSWRDCLRQMVCCACRCPPLTGSPA